MSHFTEVKVDFLQKNEKQLVAALEVQFGEGNVEFHEEGSSLKGYHGDDRSKLPVSNPNYAPPCHIVIRRKNIGSASNDVGYRRTEDGKYVAYISDFDKGANFNQAKQNKVAQEYAARVSEKQLKNQGYTVKRVPGKNGAMQIVATKFS